MFDKIQPNIMIILSSIFAIGMGILVTTIRAKSSKKPASVKKILLPPLFMSTGALMFVLPYFRVTGMEVLEAIAVGMLFSTVLIWTSKFERRDGEIYLKQSKAFIFIIIGLLVVRIVGKLILSSTIDVGQLSGMFWILAFGMIVPWRIAMFLQYMKLQKAGVIE
ncbi:cytochrome c biogenesis protein CcdC [Psychrobacillus glaciei]|uniref:Cytochrome c biogenesis protein CcdC n=1 Tax=Psychrobacillus glaciei TaxID=2283160 RepID=A0A5J6SMD6_9BACI|nr:cytochrome c biogenesis protein CcdC [Psychrobacillus glaciei]QFF99105.1 cytochrome c biogenesis protein CcdC [Psychrobacillus glaciei]